MKLRRLLSISLLSVLGLVACNTGNPSTTTTSQEPIASSSTIDTTSKITVLPSTQCKLGSVDTSKKFIDDGIGYATLTSATDGDTAAFKTTADNQSVRIRFFEIDTPESTGTVEKWGKSASKFTEEKLKAATSIILEASTTPASHDSYGERYLAWVWYKTAAMTDYVNLNLEVVENGFSESKSLPDSKYYTYFQAADAYARQEKLHIWSDDIDPYFDETVYPVTVKELVEDLASSSSKYYNDSISVGKNVAFVAYIKSKSISSTYSYVAEAINEDGSKSSITLYGGYSSDRINEGLLRVGRLVHLVGSVQKRGSAFQIAVGGTYTMKVDDEHSYNLQNDYYVTFDQTNSLYSDNYKKETGVMSYLTVTEVTVGDNKITFKGTAKSYPSATAVEYTCEVAKPSGSYANLVVGARLKFTGYQLEADSGIITIESYSDISFK